MESFQIGLIAFMLNNRAIFSQNEAEFPNIYYSNIRADETAEFIENPVLGSGEKRNVSGDHWHTYWLKRNLLEYIRHKNNNGEAVRLDDVLNVFCKLDDKSSYTEDIVRLCLGSFAQTHISDLIKLERELSSDKASMRIMNIRLSRRGAHCLDYIFDTFAYLQLVVDDHLLSVPRKWSNDFRIGLGGTYTYLTEGADNFGVLGKQMVDRKGPMVVRFLALLAAALDAERHVRPKLYDRFKRDEIKIANPTTILEGVLGELRLIGGRISTSFELDALETQFGKWKREVRDDVFSAYGIDRSFRNKLK